MLPNPLCSQHCLHLRRGAQHLHDLGPRPLAEFLIELGRVHDIDCTAICDHLGCWRRRLTPELVRAVDGDRWPPPFSVLQGGKP
jgi:hypothetical protein